MQVDPSVVDASATHESEGLSKFAAFRPAYDEHTGDELPAHLVREAREEEVAMMEGWGVWEVITHEEVYRPT
eukprot:1571002-Alexandrium_andersonii.AAC.1